MKSSRARNVRTIRQKQLCLSVKTVKLFRENDHGRSPVMPMEWWSKKLRENEIRTCHILWRRRRKYYVRQSSTINRFSRMVAKKIMWKWSRNFLVFDPKILRETRFQHVQQIFWWWWPKKKRENEVPIMSLIIWWRKYYAKRVKQGSNMISGEGWWPKQLRKNDRLIDHT